jgi:hypothetical protein
MTISGTPLTPLIDKAHLLKPGDVVAVTVRDGYSETYHKQFAEQLKLLNEAVPSVRFVMFADCDLTVLRPVSDGAQAG